jgi:subtilisin family serine protease
LITTDATPLPVAVQALGGTVAQGQSHPLSAQVTSRNTISRLARSAIRATLPFTGIAIFPWVLLGLALLLTGAVLRRRTESRSVQLQQVEGGGFGRPTHLALVVGVLVALAVAGGGLAASASSQDPPPLCGVARPVDDLLRCTSTTTPTGPSPGAQSTKSASLEERPAHLVSSTPRYVADLLLVKFRRGTTARTQADVLARAGVDEVRRISGIGAVIVHMAPDHRDDALASLRGSSSVANAEKDAVLEELDTTPNDADWSAQWGLRRVGMPKAWDRVRGSANVVVAVLDTGVAVSHPDLRDAILPGYNLIDPAKAPIDDNGHGTAVAGIIAARSNNYEGIAGVCWACSILPIKVLGADGVGDTALAAAGIVRAADAGARIISMSLGGPAGDRTLDDAIAYAVGKGTLVIAAAGNNGTSTRFYPAANPNVISVAGTDDTDHLYSWSNFGSWVQIAAPGCNAAPSLSGGYIVFCGTSSATPVVAGVAALLLSVEPTASRVQISDAIAGAVTSIGDVVSRGRIDAPGALALLAPASAPTPVVNVAMSVLTMKSNVTQQIPKRVFRRTINAGVLHATVTFTGARTVRLTIRNRSGVVVASRQGTSPLEVSQQVPSGRFSFVVSARRSAAFTLSLSFPADSGRVGE